MKYISTGGLGDSWIVYLKMLQLKDPNLSWHHVESNKIVPEICRELYKHYPATFEYDFRYVDNYKAGKWNDFIPVSSGVDGWCPLKGETTIKLENPFLNVAPPKEKEYNVVLQVSAGAKSDRAWPIDPLQLKNAIKSLGFSVALVGTDRKYEKKSDNSNFVGKLSLLETMDIVRKCGTFIGLSGFLNYYASSTRTKNIHLIETEEHEKRYYHKEWEKYSTPIKYGSINEMVRLLK